MKVSMTQHAKIQKFIATGKQLTVAQARSRLGVQNLRARVTELRQAGVAIKTVKTKTGLTAYAI